MERFFLFLSVQRGAARGVWIGVQDAPAADALHFRPPISTRSGCLIVDRVRHVPLAGDTCE